MQEVVCNELVDCVVLALVVVAVAGVSVVVRVCLEIGLERLDVGDAVGLENGVRLDEDGVLEVAVLRVVALPAA